VSFSKMHTYLARIGTHHHLIVSWFSSPSFTISHLWRAACSHTIIEGNILSKFSGAVYFNYFLVRINALFPLYTPNVKNQITYLEASQLPH
jgi:hypothetical protein